LFFQLLIGFAKSSPTLQSSMENDMPPSDISEWYERNVPKTDELHPRPNPLPIEELIKSCKRKKRCRFCRKHSPPVESCGDDDTNPPVDVDTSMVTTRASGGIAKKRTSTAANIEESPINCVGKRTRQNTDKTAQNKNSEIVAFSVDERPTPSTSAKIRAVDLPPPRVYSEVPEEVRDTDEYKETRANNYNSVRVSRAKAKEREAFILQRLFLLEKVINHHHIVPEPTEFDLPLGFGSVEFVPEKNEPKKLGLPLEYFDN
ncbi:hypothetical protein PENTCL1PPCAC_10238, partial [Pristionchus entomophagus]